MIDLDAATVLLQWSTGSLFFLWLTGKRREVGIGYGWTIRITFGIILAGSIFAGFAQGELLLREIFSIGMMMAVLAAMAVSIARRKVGVAKQRRTEEQRTARVAAMTGIDKAKKTFEDGSEFPPALDLVAPLFGLVALIIAGIDAGEPQALAVARTLIGAMFLGAITDAMLLGHWYLVQPGLARGPLNELVRWTGYVWPFELAALLWPTGMVSVLNGTIDDGYNGMLGWFWVACAISTIILVFVTRAALKERQYSAVMAATGLLYLAILTAFGMDLVARATLA
ncbi:MAG: hypothetical protein VX843_07605 [Actinomycetota bacterium]|jgi:hypothetical protein|nr:hypothetical protein [Actinomycetota bacterium]|tara:strand:+ start:33 stop:881 length:849 start_codon:yes stop_codon:yes gene_type:complete